MEERRRRRTLSEHEKKETRGPLKDRQESLPNSRREKWSRGENGGENSTSGGLHGNSGELPEKKKR